MCFFLLIQVPLTERSSDGVGSRRFQKSPSFLDNIHHRKMKLLKLRKSLLLFVRYSLITHVSHMFPVLQKMPLMNLQASCMPSSYRDYRHLAATSPSFPENIYVVVAAAVLLVMRFICGTACSHQEVHLQSVQLHVIIPQGCLGRKIECLRRL